mmetsp:Transcript_110144/g.322274  ORF Transcript_110144/g.322274 Transcript_110144/m.322274 type:complete len:202 (-) Transcript_110144:884-1489(-)
MLLQPQNPMQVQMICGLIQQQHIRPAEQSTHQSEPHLPTSGHIGHWLRDHLFGKVKHRKRLAGAVFGAISIDRLKSLLNLSEALRLRIRLCQRLCILERCSSSQCSFKFLAFLEEVPPLLVRIDDSLQSCLLTLQGRKLLSHIAKAKVLGQPGQSARGKPAQKRGLPRAILPNEAVNMASRQVEVCLLKQIHRALLPRDHN